MDLARSHWAWLAATLTLWSAWDYYDHISRPGSPFEAAPGAWFGFTAASLASVLLVAWGVTWLLERARLPELVAATLGIVMAVFSHLTVIGPLWDALFWNGGLMFKAVLVPAVIAGVGYLVFRGFFALMLRVGSEPVEAAGDGS